MPEQAVIKDRPDWMLSSMVGLTKDVSSIYKDGMTIADFQIGDKDFYWNNENIRGTFQTPEGGEDYNAFSKTYDIEKARFMKLRQAEYDANNYNTQFVNATAEKLGVSAPIPVVHRTSPDMWGRTYGYDFSDGTGFSKKQRGWRETAIDTGVQMADGKYVAPEEYDGLSKFAVDDKGSIKVNEEGNPYLVPVKDGEELKGFEQVYNPTTEWWGYYGHDYEWKHIGGSLVKNAVGFLAQTMDSLAEFPKAALHLFGEGEGSEAYKDIVNFENWTKQWNPSMTERGQESFFSLESLTDLGQQVVYQLGAMMATGGTVGGAATLLGAGAKSAQIGSVAGRLFMTGIAAGPIADTARDNGLSGKEAALLLSLTSAALYPIMQLEELVAYNKVIGTSQAGITEAIKDSSNIFLTKGFNKATARSYVSNLGGKVKNLMYKASKAPPIATSMGAEALEETLEQAVDLGVRNLYNLYSNNINEDSGFAKWAGTNKQKAFNFNWVDEMKALGLSAVGGAIGGGIAGPLMRRIRGQQPQLAYGAEEMVVDGKENVLYRYIDDMERQGRLDYTFKDTNDEYTIDEQKSRNVESAKILRGWVDYMVQLRDNQQLKTLYDNNKTKAAALEETLKTSSVGKDAAQLFSEINKINEDLASARSDTSNLGERDIKEMEATRDRKQETLDKIKRGEFVADYVAEGLYNLNSIARKSKEWNRNKLSGKNFINLSKTTPTFVDTANEEIKKENNDLLEASKSATVQNYNRVTSEGKERLVNDAEQDVISSYEALKPHADALEQAAQDAGLEFGLNVQGLLDPETREMEIFNLEQVSGTLNEQLSPLVSNMLEAQQRKEAIEKFEPSETTKEMKQSDLMLNMVDISRDNHMKNTNIPISKKINDELALREDMTQNGVSMYTGSDRLREIIKSIEARIAQVLANPVVVPQVKSLYDANEQTPIESITPEQQTEFLNELRTLHAEASALLDESEMNANSAEKQINDATINKFKTHRDKLDAIQDHFSGTEYAQIHEIISNYNETLDQMLTSGDIEGYFSTQREMEHALFEYGADSRQEILKTFNFGEVPAHEILNGDHDQKLATYNYLRGVLAVSSNDIWNSYKDVIANSSIDTLAASNEQLVGVVAAVQGLMAQNYDTFDKKLPFQNNHHNSFFLDSPGGVGKTSVMAPIVAGIMQRLNGGKIFLTSMGETKVMKLKREFNNFFKKPEGGFGAQGARSTNEDGSQKNIIKFLKTPDDNTDTNLIIYDEVTLLGTRQLDAIQKELDKINAARKANNKPLMKILYTGDTNQNSPSQGEVSTDQVQGINDKSRHQIARGEPITYSFREGNQQIRLFNNYSRDIQKQEGFSDPIVTEYSGSSGVRVMPDRKKFTTAASKLITKVKADGQLQSLVYITDRDPASLPSEITSLLDASNIMTSEQAQGEEWNYVIYDPKNDSVFSKGSNIIPKKQLHTASTRAKTFFLANLGEQNGIKSKEGKIYNVKPLKPSETTKEAQLARVSNILGDASAEISEVARKYDAPTTPPSSEAPPFDNGEEAPSETVDFDTNTTEGKFADYIQTRNERDDINLHTFFTVEGQQEAKHRAIYDQILKKPDREGHKYRVGIAKIGTPEYSNVINTDPSYNGTYAIFIEGEVNGETAVLGTLSKEDDFQEFIDENNIMEGKEKMFFDIDSSFLYGAKNFRPTVEFKSPRPRPLAEIIEQYGDNITFGDIRVVTQDMISEKGEGKITANAGEVVLPVSTAYTQKSEIEKDYANNVRSRLISAIPVNKSAVKVSTIENELSEFMVDGKFDMSEGKIVYATMFGHEAMDVKLPDTTKKIGRMVETINRIYDDIPATETDYKNLVKKYTRRAPSEVDDELSLDQFDDQVAESKGYKKDSVDKPFYLFADYMESKAKTRGGKTKLFERLLEDIQKDERYQNGFWFNPRLDFGTTDPEKNNVHATAHKGMDRLYQTYLTSDVSMVSPPSISISKPNLLQALSKGIKPPQPEVQDSVSLDGKVTESNAAVEGDEADIKNLNETTEESKVESLLDYQRKFFDKRKIAMLPESITRFKREFYDAFFNQNTGKIETPQGGITRLEQALQVKADEFKGDLTDLDLVNNEADRSAYIDHVIVNNIPFLMKEYAPTVQQVDGEWMYVTKHTKNKSFNDKESFSLLKEGLTEMIRTQIENTPVLRKIGDNKYEETGRYLNPRSDVEEVIDAFKQAKEQSTINGTQSIVDILEGSNSEVLQSVYAKFYAQNPVEVNGVEKVALNEFDDGRAYPIVDAMSVFFMSGEVFNLGFVESMAGNQENKIPINKFWRKRTFIYEHGQQAMQNVADNVEVGASIMSSTNHGKTYTIDGNSYTRGVDYDTPKVVQAFHDIGMTFVAEEHLDNMLEYSASAMQITGASFEEQVAQRNKYLMDNIVFKALANIKSGKVDFIQATPTLYRAIARVDGINVGMDMLNVSGNRVYRLRNTSPIFSVNKRLAEAATNPMFSNNMMGNHYQIVDFFLKDGFKKREKGRTFNRSNNSLSWQETMEYDLIWNFADTLEKTSGKSFAVPLMVYSDGASDITPVISLREPHSIFTDKAINEVKEKLFNSRVDYYTAMEQQVVSKWNALLGTDYKTIGSINTHLKQKPQTIDVVKGFKPEAGDGMVPNIDYTVERINDVSYGVINPALAKDIKFYKHGNYKKFETQIDTSFEEFRMKIEELNPKHRIKQKISKRTSRDVDSVIRAFYYNWAAISSETTAISMGDTNQYKGTTKTKQYIDFTKRAKAEMSNHSMQIFRNDGWHAMRNEAQEAGKNLTDKELYEGYKLTRNYKVAYVNDPETSLNSLAGEFKNQEIYDGATFVTPLTRIFQRASNGGVHGTNVSHIMKNITTSQKQGVTTFVKNAEFELTPTILQNGTERTVRMAKNMLDVKFNPVMAEDLMKEEQELVEVDSAYTYMVNALGMKPDFSNVEYDHFDRLAEFLVRNGLQDTPILETLPTTSVKTGGGAQSDIDAESYTAESIDIFNKGTQLDASKDPTKSRQTTATSQLFNTIGLNWRNPEAVAQVHEGLAALAAEVGTEYSNLAREGGLDERMRQLIKAASDINNNAITYQHKLLDTDYSFDDRQMLNKAISQLNAELTKSGIALKFEGTQYIIHPSNGLIRVYDQGGKTYTKKNAPEGAVERELLWQAPTKNGVALDAQNEDGSYIIPEYQALIESRGTDGFQEAQMNLDRVLQEEGWDGGIAEIMLPSEMRKDFGLTEGMAIESVTVDYFKTRIRTDRNDKKQKPLTDANLEKRAKMMMESFEKRLEGIMIRIPTTGKHSAVVTKVAAFVDGSDNAAFVPAELLMIQGADQDIDKGTYLTYEVIDGIIPEVDENNELISAHKQMIPRSKHAQARLAGMRNRVVDGIQQVIQSPLNTVEANVSVDAALQVLKDLRDQAQSNVKFERDSYISYAQMHEINQAGKALVGIFANGLKAYQVMYDTFKSQGEVDNDLLAGLGDDFNTVWINFAGLVNAATDNAKEQILGTLGVDTHNANMVSYLVSRGMTFETIVTFLKTHEEALNKLRDSKRYDSTAGFFDPERAWKGNDALINVYKKGEEFALFANALSLNRDLPNSSYDMYRYRENIEKFVNDSLVSKKVVKSSNFSLTEFINNDSYADQYIDLYESLLNFDDHDYNILRVFKGSTHMRAYSKLYSTAVASVNRISNITRVSNRIADNLDDNRISEDTYRDITEFAYGLAVNEYLSSLTAINGTYELDTIDGRNDFVAYMGDNSKSGHIAYLKAKYPDNPFVQKGLFVEKTEKFKYDSAPQLRTHELNNMSEQDLLALQVGFDILEDIDKKDLVNYALITRKGAMGRGSIAQLFDPEDTTEFASYLKGFDIDDAGATADRYNNYRNNVNGTTHYHNSIPYSIAEDAPEGNTGSKVINSGQAHVLNTVIGKLDGDFKVSANTRVTPDIIDQIDVAMRSDQLKENDKTKLNNIHRSLTENPASNKKANQKIKDCS